MDEEKRKSSGVIILLGGIVIISVLFFLWGFINKGTIKIYGQTPFEVEIYGVEKLTCNKNPCEISQKTGTQNLIISKEGYETFLKTVEVNLWQTSELEIEFNIVPHFSKTEKIPIPGKEYSYKIVKDDGKQMYKLVKDDDNLNHAIVYFSKKINNPVILGSDKSVLLLDGKTTYRIDLKNKTREIIENANLQNIEKGKWSPDGNNFVFQTSDDEMLWLIDEQNNVKKLTLKKNITSFDWAEEGLIFATKQGYSSTTAPDAIQENTVEILEEEYAEYLFGKYLPDKNIYIKIAEFKDYKENSLIEKLVAFSNEKIIYFEIGGESYNLYTF